jgi:ASCH domain
VHSGRFVLDAAPVFSDNCVMTIERALSIRQPYAWLVANGIKDIENRSWATSKLGEFVVHASSNLFGTIDERERLRQWVWERFDVEVPDDEDLERGGIVGRCELIDVVRSSRSPWFIGPVGFVLDRARPLPFRRYSGRLGFFEVTLARPDRRTSWRRSISA